MLCFVSSFFYGGGGAAGVNLRGDLLVIFVLDFVFRPVIVLSGCLIVR